MANAVVIGKYLNEAAALNAPLELLTDNDTFTSLLYIDPELPPAVDPLNPVAGELEHSSNELDAPGIALVINQATVFVGESELLDARELEGRYQAQFPELDVRLAPATVSVTLGNTW
jgi:hypothetical protein